MTRFRVKLDQDTKADDIRDVIESCGVEKVHIDDDGRFVDFDGEEDDAKSIRELEGVVSVRAIEDSDSDDDRGSYIGLER